MRFFAALPVAFLAAMALLFGLTGTVRAQLLSDQDPDWKESDAPPPPAFDIGKLIPFDVPSTSSLVYGVDPASVRISQRDGVVRYVVVARSATGAINAMYEGLRCSTAQVKTYARYAADGWKSVDNAAWTSLKANQLSKHALAFAKAGACDNTVVPDSANVLVRRLKDPGFRASQ